MTAKKSELLLVNNLTITFQTFQGAFKAIDRASFIMEKGDSLGVAGESGCGKSTLALSILRLVPKPGKIVGGKIFFDNRELLSLNEEEMRKVRGKEISMIFQEPMTSLNPVFTIGDQLLEPLLTHEKITKKEAEEKIISLLTLVNIPNPQNILKVHPHELSGGMRQRVMIVMALSCNPHLLIADEPTSALDTITQLQLIKLLKKLKDERKMSMMMISHNLSLLAETCNKIMILYAGKIVEQAPTEVLFKKPRHPYTRGLLMSIPMLSGSVKRLKTIAGEVPDALNASEGCPFHPRCKLAEKICAKEDPEMVKVEKDHFVRCRMTGG